MGYSLEPIACIRSCYGEKFATPRQPGLVPAARASISLASEYRDAVIGLENFSHIWLCFWFDQTADKGWSPTVRPPRLGGNQRIGVFATRSNFRPNPIGWSVVELLNIDSSGPELVLTVAGADIVDGTPLLDIKPYLPYADKVEHASAGFAATAPPASLKVEFSEAVFNMNSCPSENVLEMIRQTLSLDPRPAYKKSETSGEYGALLAGCNVRWRVDGQTVYVVSIKKSS